MIWFLYRYLQLKQKIYYNLTNINYYVQDMRSKRSEKKQPAKEKEKAYDKNIFTFDIDLF